MDQKERALGFAALHVKGDPIVLYNAWDAGSAKAIAKAGAKAIATSSWAVAAAHGYADGQAIGLPFLEQIIARVVAAVDLPVSVDVEGGYSDVPQVCAENVERLVYQGVAGINFEDRVVAGKGLHAIAEQSARIAAIRRMANSRGVPLFINARTDIFFGAGIDPKACLAEACERAAAYAKAGASGLFVPGLVDLGVIVELARAIDLPLNVMAMPGLPDAKSLADAGVARISHGPGAYLTAMNAVSAAATGLYA